MRSTRRGWMKSRGATSETYADVIEHLSHFIEEV